jgi:hypothetical protein
LDICVTGQTYTLKCYKFMTLKKAKPRYIYKEAFDHLPCAVPKDSILIDKESTTVVKLHSQKSKSSIDNCYSTTMVTFRLQKSICNIDNCFL